MARDDAKPFRACFDRKAAMPRGPAATGHPSARVRTAATNSGVAE